VQQLDQRLNCLLMSDKHIDGPTLPARTLNICFCGHFLDNILMSLLYTLLDFNRVSSFLFIESKREVHKL